MTDSGEREALDDHGLTPEQILEIIASAHRDSLAEPGWCNQCAFAWPCWEAALLADHFDRTEGTDD